MSTPCAPSVQPLCKPCANPCANLCATSVQHQNKPCSTCAVSGRHGSIASCASLPDDTSLPQPDFSSTPPPLSRQASEAPSSCFDGPEALSNTAAAAEVQSSSSAAPRNSLRHNRAVSWSPQTTARLIAVRLTLQHAAGIHTFTSLLGSVRC